MRNINLRNTVLPASLLAILMVAATHTGCSTGDSNATGGAGTTGTSTGTSGTTGTSTGTSGTTGTGTAGTTGTSTGTAGTTGTGTGTAGTTGTAGSTGTAGMAPPTTGVCAGMGTRMLMLDQGKVDDFEETMILAGWSSFNDVMPVGNAIKIAQEAGGAIGTAHAGHYMGSGAKPPTMGGYGVGAIYNMAIDKTSGIYCVDVSNFDGVTFWAKSPMANAKIGVNFVTPVTNMAPDGDCPGPTGCYNHPQKLVTLSAEWTQYNVTFASATGGTGAKVLGRIQQIGFLSPEATWDYYIDEIQLYKGTAPATAVGGNSTM